MQMQEYFKRRINKVAEMHFYLKPILIKSLKQQYITKEGQIHTGIIYETYYDYWKGSYNENFYDMAIFIRLGSEIELCLRQYYMNKKGYKTLKDLYIDKKYRKGIFQRVQSWQGAEGVINLFLTELNIDLATNQYLTKIQEIMTHRHLYAHSSGIINDEYIKDIEKITGFNLLNNSKIKNLYKNEDFYYFPPLEKLNEFIEDSREFFRLLI